MISSGEFEPHFRTVSSSSTFESSVNLCIAGCKEQQRDAIQSTALPRLDFRIGYSRTFLAHMRCDFQCKGGSEHVRAVFRSFRSQQAAPSELQHWSRAHRRLRASPHNIFARDRRLRRGPNNEFEAMGGSARARAAFSIAVGGSQRAPGSVFERTDGAERPEQCIRTFCATVLCSQLQKAPGL